MLAWFFAFKVWPVAISPVAITIIIVVVDFCHQLAHHVYQRFDLVVIPFLQALGNFCNGPCCFCFLFGSEVGEGFIMGKRARAALVMTKPADLAVELFGLECLAYALSMNGRKLEKVLDQAGFVSQSLS